MGSGEALLVQKSSIRTVCPLLDDQYVYEPQNFARSWRRAAVWPCAATSASAHRKLTSKSGLATTQLSIVGRALSSRAS